MKLKPFYLLVIFVFLLLWSRLFWLQIIKGAENRELAQNNRIKIIDLPAVRGVIYDRSEKILVRNKPQQREYLFGDSASHLTGYIGEISQQELENSRQYDPGDIVGKMGLEKEYDRYLRGVDGGKLVETDVFGEVKREIKREEPENGKNIHTTIDIDFQQKVFGVLEGQIGAVVVTDPNNGEVLALACYPSFDSNLFTSEQVDDESLNRLFKDQDRPLFNRAISGLYPPASTFKIVTAIAGLEEEVVDINTLIEDKGEIKIGPQTYSNWYYTQYGGTEGMINIVDAIKRSNDIYFYQLGRELGIEKLAHWAKYFGMGQKLGIDLPGESSGLIPTPEWKKNQKTEDWYLGDTVISSIGQGNLLATPLQVNQLASVIASNGKFCRPHLIKDTQLLKQNKEDLCYQLSIEEDNLDAVRQGMKKACSPAPSEDQKGGTGYPFFDFSPQVGCKTGTAEISSANDQTHAWFTVFMPFEAPEVVVTVLLEKAGEGSKEAAPLAKEILEYWLDSKN